MPIPLRLRAIHHVQLVIPRGSEATARRFYGDVLGLREIAKPEQLRARGGLWFEVGSQQLHLGIDDGPVNRKSHVAFETDSVDAVRECLEANGLSAGADVALPGMDRCETRDPFGNRLEFVALWDEVAHDGDPVLLRAEETFGNAAAAYVTSAIHASGDDLAELVRLAACRPADHALDVATGAGHVALALAPRVAHVVATDLSARMLAVAHDFITSRGVGNVTFVTGQAGKLPFVDHAFDLVTCRIAAHHFPDVRLAVSDMRRVLKPDGRVIIIDNIAPADDTLGDLLNRWERWRVPSHVRAYTVAEWRAFLEEAGFTITDLATGRKYHPFHDWANRVSMPAEAVGELEAEMLGSSADAHRYFELTSTDTGLETWSEEYMIVACSAAPDHSMRTSA